MAKYLSQEWLDEGRKLAEDQPVRPGATAKMQYVVTGGPDGDVAYAVEIDGGRVRLTSGRAPAADVTITEDYETATAIHQGKLTLQDAFMAGRVKVAGNLATLVAHQGTLAAVDVDLPRADG